MDNLEDAQKMVERRKLTFPLAYGMDAKRFANMTGAFYDEKKLFLHATGFDYVQRLGDQPFQLSIQ